MRRAEAEASNGRTGNGERRTANGKWRTVDGEQRLTAFEELRLPETLIEWLGRPEY